MIQLKGIAGHKIQTFTARNSQKLSIIVILPVLLLHVPLIHAMDESRTRYPGKIKCHARTNATIGLGNLLDQAPWNDNIEHLKLYIKTCRIITYQMLETAVVRRDSTAVGLLLEAVKFKAQIFKRKYASGRYEKFTTLTVAAMNGDTEIVALLLEHGAPINMKDGFSCTALMRAISGKNIDVIRFLLNHDANIHVKNRFGQTTVENAIDTGDLEIVNILLDKIDTVDASLIGQVALWGSVEMMKLFIPKATDFAGALETAAQFGNEDMLKELLPHCNEEAIKKVRNKTMHSQVFDLLTKKLEPRKQNAVDNNDENSTDHTTLLEPECPSPIDPLPPSTPPALPQLPVNAGTKIAKLKLRRTPQKKRRATQKRRQKTALTKPKITLSKTHNSCDSSRGAATLSTTSTPKSFALTAAGVVCLLFVFKKVWEWWYYEKKQNSDNGEEENETDIGLKKGFSG